jgi:hypothetical protein
VLGFALPACGGDDDDDRERPSPRPRPALAVGLTEFNPNLLWTARERPEVADGFGPTRDRVVALRPSFYRLVIDWNVLQPRPDVPPNLDLVGAGCARDLPPCGEARGVRDVLRAIRSQRRANGGRGPEVLVVPLAAPEWAANPRRGCEPPNLDFTARGVRPDALDSYRQLIIDLAALGEAEGVPLRYWAAWNEPNLSQFLAPQRARCDPGSPSLTPAAYARLFGEMRRALDAAPGAQTMVAGEIASVMQPRPTATAATEFIADLPRDVVCATDIWTQHAYVGDNDVVPEVERALDARGCERRHRIWITETGAGADRPGDPRPADPAAAREGCRRLHERLLAWHRDPRVEAAFQYTFREDPAFPVGLADPGVRAVYPTYYAWRAWGGERDPEDPPPALPAECRG